MKYLYYLLGVMFLAVVCLSHQLKTSRQECRRMTENVEALTSSVRKFQVEDSLNAARVGVLTMKCKEYENLRSEDAECIKALGYKVKDLKTVTDAQTRTIINLRGSVRDSILYVDKVRTDTLRCIDICDKWFSLSGCIGRDSTFSGRAEVRDSLKILYVVRRKRFLGFLWRTRKVKERHVDVISANPHTKIEGVNFVELEE